MRPTLQALPDLSRLLFRVLRTGKPEPLSTQQRLANLVGPGAPVEAPVEIRWDAHQIPSIRAGSERDLAAALGVVHAHLRLAQMELMRRLARGTVSAVLGRAALPLDHALRLLRLGSAVPAMTASLPPATRLWAEAFIAGVNHHIARAPARPYEFRVLGLAPELWTLEDLLLISRLAATDISWMLFARLLPGQSGRSPQAWDRLWPELQSGDTLPSPETAAQHALGLFRGSNAAAVAASATAHGAGLIASDPHLPITLPPVWLIAGLHAPGLDAVGLMLPGLPVLALGRSAHLAWGGTSLHAASSELIDVAGEPMTERVEHVPVRNAPAAAIRLRETRFGPVVSDGVLFRFPRPLALRWVGHRPSDELTAMLGVMRARSLEEFRAALAGFAIPGQTMVAVEPHGQARRVLAAHLPRRSNRPAARLIARPDEAWSLDDLVPAADLPTVPEEIVVSANDRPAATPVPVGFFFSPADRVERMRRLLHDARPVSLAAMRRLQLDVEQATARSICAELLPRLPQGRARRVLAEWDGAYQAHSQGALAFEVLTAGLARRMLTRADLRLLSAIWTGRALIGRRIAAAPAHVIRAAARDAARALRRYRDWGGAHRLSVRSPLAALPGVGHWFAAPDWAAPGGNETLNKTGHGPVRGRHRVTYGACARHLSDLSNPDDNWFVLLGGQDGWPGSANFTDQTRLWRDGRAIRVPLRHASDGPHLTRLAP